MKQRLLTPGPTPVPEETLLELAKPVFYHRSPQFRQTTTSGLTQTNPRALRVLPEHPHRAKSSSDVW